jgi:hypothetical protein
MAFLHDTLALNWSGLCLKLFSIVLPRIFAMGVFDKRYD